MSFALGRRCQVLALRDVGPRRFYVRSSAESAASRAGNGKRSGGFNRGATDEGSQQRADEQLLSTLMVELSKHRGVEVTLLHYPSHVVDANYSAFKLSWLLRRYNISQRAFVKAHTSLRNMGLVHSADLAH